MKRSWLGCFSLALIVLLNYAECGSSGGPRGNSTSVGGSSAGGGRPSAKGTSASAELATTATITIGDSGGDHANETESSTAMPVQNATVHFKEKEPSLHNGLSVFMPMKPMIKSVNSTAINGTISSNTTSSSSAEVSTASGPFQTDTQTAAESMTSQTSAGKPPNPSSTGWPKLERAKRMATPETTPSAEIIKFKKRSVEDSPVTTISDKGDLSVRKDYNLRKALWIRRSAGNMKPWIAEMKKETDEIDTGGKPLHVRQESDYKLHEVAGSNVKLVRLSARAKRLAPINVDTPDDTMGRMKRVVKDMANKPDVEGDPSPQAHHIAKILMGILENSKEEQYLAKHKIIPRKKVQEKDNKKRTTQQFNPKKRSKGNKKESPSFGKRMSVMALAGIDKRKKGSNQRHKVGSAERDELIEQKCTTKLIRLPHPGKFLQVMDVPAEHAKDISLDELHRYLAKKRKQMGLRPVDLASKILADKRKRKASSTSGKKGKGPLLQQVESRLFKALKMILGDKTTTARPNKDKKRVTTQYWQSGSFEKRWLPKTRAELFTIIENSTQATVSDSSLFSAPDFEVLLTLRPSEGATTVTSSSSTKSDAEWLKDLIMEAAGINADSTGGGATTTNDPTTVEHTQTYPSDLNATDQKIEAQMKVASTTVKKADDCDRNEKLKRTTTSLGAMIHEFEHWPFPATSSTTTSTANRDGQSTSTSLPGNSETTPDGLHDGSRSTVFSTTVVNSDEHTTYREFAYHDHTRETTTVAGSPPFEASTEGTADELVEVASTIKTSTSKSTPRSSTAADDDEQDKLTTCDAMLAKGNNTENPGKSATSTPSTIAEDRAYTVETTGSSSLDANSTNNMSALDSSLSIQAAAKRMQNALLKAKKMLAEINEQSKEIARKQLKEMVLSSSTITGKLESSTAKTGADSTKKSGSTKKAKSKKTRKEKELKKMRAKDRKKSKKPLISGSMEELYDLYSDSREMARASSEFELMTGQEKWDSTDLLPFEREKYEMEPDFSLEMLGRGVGERRHLSPFFVRKRRGGQTSAADAAEEAEDDMMAAADMDEWESPP